MGKRDWDVKFMWIGRNWRKCQNSNIWDVLDESGIVDAMGYRKIMSGRKVTSPI